MRKLFLCLLTLACACALAEPLIITSASPDWIYVPGPNPTWVLPASIPGCGNENEPACEPTGIWYFNQPWSGTPSIITMHEPTGELSDFITFDSLGPGGLFRIQFFSDPNLESFGDYQGYSVYADYTEGDDGYITGPIGVCCILNSPFFLNVNIASDGEIPFHPFGVNFDVSDGIQFEGPIVVPEPAAFGLFAGGLGFILILRRKL